ncbi:hypothetical protein [Burkholderia gladioli]|uniref:hypothetical protein n=1 Tax=Burkholderia gladioli TaxID=28095 RepID=UPI0022D43F8D|nr:hypothetical protein [Burkholderia gladioli]MDA0576175.1 hypothetical protein [Burkholderia gladioli]MDA0604269.1 hypothetical protein [Burkholderia gladioli]
MSEVATLVHFGEFHSAWFYRDLYLRNGTKYDEFWCPFCGIKVFAILIYKPADAELARSPHFREQEPHRHDCDGNPAKGGKASVAAGPVRKIEKQLFTLPTRLIEYVEPPEQVRRANRPEHPTEPSPDEVKRRRLEAGEIHHRARFSVSLVQSLAEAHLGTIRQSYQLKDKGKWSDKQRSDWLKAVLRTEIDLRGATMRYDQAFHDLFFPVRSTPRVYHGEGTVSATDEGYRIDASRRGRVDDQDKHGRPFHVRVRADRELASQRGARRELIAQLQRAEEKGFPVKWYGYGQPETVGDGFELGFDEENLTDLFVRRQPSKKIQPAQEGFSQSIRNKPDSDEPPARTEANGGGGRSKRTFEATLVDRAPEASMRTTKSITEAWSSGTAAGLGPVFQDGASPKMRPPTPSVAAAIRDTNPKLGGRTQDPTVRNESPQSMRSSPTKADVAAVSSKAVALANGAAKVPTTPSSPEHAAEAQPGVAETEVRRQIWLAAVQKEYDAIVLEQIAAAAAVVAAFRTETLAPHQQRKPLLWGRSAWKEKLAELETQDQRNVARWTLLQQRRLMPKETDSVMREAKRRARMNGTDEVTASEE